MLLLSHRSVQHCSCKCTRDPNLLVGNSIVGRETDVFLKALSGNSTPTFPGTRDSKVVEEVAKLDLNRNRTILLAVLAGTTSSSRTSSVRSRRNLWGTMACWSWQFSQRTPLCCIWSHSSQVPIEQGLQQGFGSQPALKVLMHDPQHMICWPMDDLLLEG